jgi:choline dehydrogenase-like flavoprotein
VCDNHRSSHIVNIFVPLQHWKSDADTCFPVDPVLSRRNLVVFSQALVTKLDVTSAGYGQVCASGVQVRFPDGSIQFAKTKGEVILSAGTFRTPQLLELSGIGDPKVLNPLGIDVVVNLPGVGENYEDQ